MAGASHHGARPGDGRLRGRFRRRWSVDAGPALRRTRLPDDLPARGNRRLQRIPHQVKLYVQAPDGSAVWLRSFFWNTKDDTSLHDAERQIAALWAWAQSRGLVRDDGRYVPVTNPGIERKRRGAADRLEYLHALGR